MSKVETYLEQGVSLEHMLQQHLKDLKEELKQQLEEIKKRQEEELEKRICQNALLSKDVDILSNSPTPVLTSHTLKQTQMPCKSSLALLSSAHSKQGSIRTQPCERSGSLNTIPECKEEEATAECLRKFSARPVPGHVARPFYQQMLEVREKERKQNNEKRRDFLISTQKPFSFLEREKKKREKMMEALDKASLEQKNNVTPARKPKDSRDSPDAGIKEQETASKKVHIQTAAVEQDNLTPSPKLRIADRTRREKLGFLDQEPSFQPKIIGQVPDFNKLHKTFQKEVQQKTASRNGMNCRPFTLRTSDLSARRRWLSPENSQVPKIDNLRRSRSLGALNSISGVTLPTFITDSVKKRSEVVRKSIEIRESKETDQWSKDYQMKSKSMKKTVALHAKLLDPHSSLKEVYNEKLQHHREADQQRMRDYNRALRDMKARVRERPYLFEQVKQKTARAQAEQMFRNKLQKVHVKEQFVEKVGDAHNCEDDTDVNGFGGDSGTPDRKENVDNGKKIEDVEEKSVKSKEEEMP